MADAPPIEKESPAEEEEVAAPIDKAAPAPAEEKEAFVEVTGGRRRGRRRVMKKKTMKDEKGYLGSFVLFQSFKDLHRLIILAFSYERRARMGVILRG